jgi:hypothetical protein
VLIVDVVAVGPAIIFFEIVGANSWCGVACGVTRIGARLRRAFELGHFGLQCCDVGLCGLELFSGSCQSPCQGAVCVCQDRDCTSVRSGGYGEVS